MTTVCCPLSNDGDGAIEELFHGTVKARKEHTCIECREPIIKGQRHELIKGVWEGAIDTFRTCLLCVEIRDHFACGNGWMFGCVWEQLTENFFPDMRAGGPCMAGLSPEAKTFLIAERMEWYFDQDECDDSRWDGWTPDKPPRETTPHWNARIPGEGEEPEPAKRKYGLSQLFGDDDEVGWD